MAQGYGAAGCGEAMTTSRSNALAIHVCANLSTAASGRPWPALASFADSIQCAIAICDSVGIVEQVTLTGEQATPAAVLGALDAACTRLDDDALLVLTFAGHAERGTGPLHETRWCLFGGGLTIAALATKLARLPERARLVVIVDTCYAAAIAAVLAVPQPALVLASCGEDQTSIARARSDLMVRLESFVCADRQGSLAELRDVLEHDTPDCERPTVWTNTATWWSARPFDLRPGHDSRLTFDTQSEPPHQPRKTSCHEEETTPRLASRPPAERCRAHRR